jgi:5-methylcytosine-specific restriction endonuclease McrA
MRKKDYTGTRYGRLTAVSDTGKIKHTQAVWLFKCDCGAFVERRVASLTSSIRSGNTPGCPECVSRFRDITGQTFGKLTAIELLDRCNPANIIWLFECTCGARVARSAHNVSTTLKKGFTPSCGSLKCDARHRDEDALINQLVARYRKNAKAKNRLFALSVEECIALFRSNCHYCGVEPSQVMRHRVHRPGGRLNEETYTYNGIDRIDNEVGYIAGNVVACCGTCNHAKRDMTYDEFLTWVYRVHQHQVSYETAQHNS